MTTATTARPLTEVLMYTDGGCKGNPGPGGWGVVLVAGSSRSEPPGAEPLDHRAEHDRVRGGRHVEPDPHPGADTSV